MGAPTACHTPVEPERATVVERPQVPPMLRYREASEKPFAFNYKECGF